MIVEELNVDYKKANELLLKHGSVRNTINKYNE